LQKIQGKSIFLQFFFHIADFCEKSSTFAQNMPLQNITKTKFLPKGITN